MVEAKTLMEMERPNETKTQQNISSINFRKVAKELLKLNRKQKRT